MEHGPFAGEVIECIKCSPSEKILDKIFRLRNEYRKEHGEYPKLIELPKDKLIEFIYSAEIFGMKIKLTNGELNVTI